MKTLAIVSQKGGAGKTTIATSLAVEAQVRGLQTLLIDLDPQGSSYKWGQRRESPTPAVITAQALALDEITKNAEAQGVDLIILDTAPHSQRDAKKACEVSNLVLIPCRPSIHDLDAIEDTLSIAQLVKTPAFVVLNSTPPNAPRQFEDVKASLVNAYGAQVMDISLAQRSEFVHSATGGLTANESEPEGKAAAEIRALYDAIDLLALTP